MVRQRRSAITVTIGIQPANAKRKGYLYKKQSPTSFLNGMKSGTLHSLVHRQNGNGFLDDEALQQLAKESNVSLYRLEGPVESYSSFRRTPGPRVSVGVCRDVTCALAGCQRSVSSLILNDALALPWIRLCFQSAVIPPLNPVRRPLLWRNQLLATVLEISLLADLLPGPRPVLA